MLFAGKEPYLPKLIALGSILAAVRGEQVLGRDGSLQLLDVRVWQDLVDYCHIRRRSYSHVRVGSHRASHGYGKNGQRSDIQATRTRRRNSNGSINE